MGVVKTVYGISHKLNNKDTTMIFMGYSLKHGTNVFRMYNTETRNCSTTCDVVWLNLLYGEWKELKNIFPNIRLILSTIDHSCTYME